MRRSTRPSEVKRACARAATSLALVVLLGALPSACQEATAIRLRVRTDVPWAQGRSIHVTASTPEDIGAAAPTAVVEEWAGADVGDLVVVPRSDKRGAATVRVVLGVTKDASLCTEAAPDGCIFARRALSFVARRTLELPVALHAACVSVACDESSTCNALGRCVSATVEPSACGEDGCTVEGDEPRAALAPSAATCRHYRFGEGWVDVPPSPDLTLPGPATLEAWVRYDAAFQQNAEQHVISHHAHDHTGATSTGYLLMVWGFPNDLGVGTRWYAPGRPGFAGSTQVGFGSGSRVEPDRWTHIAASTDGKALRIFVDGVLKGTGTIPAPPTAAPYDGPLRLGAVSYNERGGFHFRGAIDELRISRADRYPAGFTPSRAPFAPDGDTVALYHFDEADGDVAIDSSGRGHHGAIVGAIARGTEPCP